MKILKLQHSDLVHCLSQGSHFDCSLDVSDNPRFLFEADRVLRFFLRKHTFHQDPKDRWNFLTYFRSSEWTEINLWDCWFLNIKYWCWETFCSFPVWQLASEDPCLCNGKSFIFVLHYGLWHLMCSWIHHTSAVSLPKTCQLKRTSDTRASPVPVVYPSAAFLLYFFGEPKFSCS